MKFGHEYEQALANDEFPRRWIHSAIDYKHLKKCIKKVHRELSDLGLDQETVARLIAPASTSPDVDTDPSTEHHDYFSAVEPSLASIPEEFTPQLRVLVDSQTGNPLDAKLTSETREALQKLARRLIISEEHSHHSGSFQQSHSVASNFVQSSSDPRKNSIVDTPETAKWVQIPLASARKFFNLLEPKLQDLEILRDAETRKLEDDILDLGDAVENVVQPVRDGFEAKRRVSYRDLYFWREMFRLYMEKPIFYSETECGRGALSFTEAKKRLEDYDAQLRSTGLLAKMTTRDAQQAAKKFLDLNVDILRIMHFQEMNARAMTKILKKFDKQTHLEAQYFLKSLRNKYPLLLPHPVATAKDQIGSGKPTRTLTTATTGGFAHSIARDINAEILTKLLSIVPQPDDWACPVCFQMAWRPVSLGCCRARFCIRCVIHLQDEHMARCPCCNSETVLAADGRNLDFEAMDFLEKYFPLEVRKRQKENERAQLVRQYGEDFVKPSCVVM